jgi:tRNA-intron endonuclease
MTEGCEKAEGEVLLREEKGRILLPKEDNALLREKHFGDSKGTLSRIEALYLLERRSFRLVQDGREVTFGELLRDGAGGDPRLLPRYIVYRDWRDRGVFPFEVDRAPEVKGKAESSPATYPSQPTPVPKVADVTCHFFPEAEMSMIFDQEVAERLYYEAWIGQLGKYKQEKAGTNLSLDLMETIHLLRGNPTIEVIDSSSGKGLSLGDLLEFGRERHPGIEDLLMIYDDWRRSGYIVKTGFKFGAHFRIYFPGAGTGKNKWVHSKHVLHVFPKSYSMLMSEWGRIIRLSQSVRKTFILGVPKLLEEDYDDRERADLILYHRTRDGVQDPGREGPTFLCIAIPETSRMSGLEFANALREAEMRGLQLLIAVVDRETDINYYVARKIRLKDSENGYYEIYWYRP